MKTPLSCIVFVVSSIALGCSCQDGSKRSPEAGADEIGGGGGFGGMQDAGADASSKAGGASGSGGGSGGGVGGASPFPNEHSWIFESGNRVAIEAAPFTQPRCSVFALPQARQRFPSSEWQQCGEGCSVIEPLLGISQTGDFPRMSTTEAGNEAFALLTFTSHFDDSAKRYKLLRSIRLDNGATVGALVADTKKDGHALAACSFDGPAETAVVVDLVGGDDPATEPSESKFILGFVPLASASWTWAAPALGVREGPQGRMTFDLDRGASLLKIGFGAVRVMHDPSKNEWETLEEPSGSYIGMGQGDLGVWLDDAEDHRRLRGWAPDSKGIRTLIEKPPVHTCKLAVSPSYIVGTAETGQNERQCWPIASEGRLWYSPRAYDASKTRVIETGQLPGAPFTIYGVKTWADYAAAFVNEQRSENGVDYVASGTPYLLVVRLSDSRTWRIRAREGGVHPEAWTLTNQYLYFAENALFESNEFRRIRRIELAKLDAAAEVL